MEVSPAVALDLNTLPRPKKEPKEEPLDEVLNPLLPQPSASAAGSSASVSQVTTDLSSAMVMTPLQSVPPNPDEDYLYREYYRLANMYLSSAGAAAGSIIPIPVNTAGSGSALAHPPGPVKKLKPRSSEMVRVSSIGVRDQIYFRDVVRRARITFESLRTLLIREEDNAPLNGVPHQRRVRADLRASSLMRDRELWLNRDRRIIGHIPGIAVGDAFFYRMELCVLGLHGQVQAGIDYVSAGHSASGEPIATSIIVSGGYEDDDDRGDLLIYTGHGGRDYSLHKQCGDQKLDSGNLALERSMFYGVEVRVIRAVKCRESPIGKVYFYDGLYKVVDYWQETGKAGFGVYKFKMLRLEGQDAMGSETYHFAQKLKVEPVVARPQGYVSFDLSLGRENFPVWLYNDVDAEREPVMFEYLARPIYPPSVVNGKYGGGGGGCECRGGCSVGCSCADRNGGEFAYSKSGTLMQGKPVVYECGPYCSCPSSCPNRVTQNGLRHRLEVFRSQETGWGVRSLDLIQAGTFICEFSGVVVTQQQIPGQGDCLVYPQRFPRRHLDWGDVSDVVPEYVAPDYPPLPNLNFALDVSRARNVACYLSHSCTPNVFLQYVLYDHYNAEYPHLMIFAMENIPPLRELSIDYGVSDEWVGVGQLTM